MIDIQVVLVGVERCVTIVSGTPIGSYLAFAKSEDIIFTLVDFVLIHLGTW